MYAQICFYIETFELLLSEYSFLAFVLSFKHSWHLLRYSDFPVNANVTFYFEESHLILIDLGKILLLAENSFIQNGYWLCCETKRIAIPELNTKTLDFLISLCLWFPKISQKVYNTFKLGSTLCCTGDFKRVVDLELIKL